MHQISELTPVVIFDHSLKSFSVNKNNMYIQISKKKKGGKSKLQRYSKKTLT